jgi:RNA polymerase-interacting CarD/CdnL/TRCF family regulator
VISDEDAKPTHVTDRGGIIEVSVKAADGLVYTWRGTGSIELVETTQQDGVTKKYNKVKFIQAHLALDPEQDQAILPVRPAKVKGKDASRGWE